MSRPVYSSSQQNRVIRIVPDLIRGRELLVDLVWKDLRAQYRYAYMGFLWAVVEPLMMTLVLTFVFTVVLNHKMGAAGGAPFAVNLLCAYLFWKFFSDSVAAASGSLVNNRSLVDKVNFPREIIPLASVGFCAVNLAIGFVIFLAVAGLFGIWPTARYIWLPVVFGVELALVAGLALLFSSLNARYRDVSYMVGVGLVFGFYASPVFYDLELVRSVAGGGKWAWLINLYFLNPMAGLISSYRHVLVEGAAPEALMLGWPAVIAALALAAGVVVFRKSSGTLADHL